MDMVLGLMTLSYEMNCDSNVSHKMACGNLVRRYMLVRYRLVI